MATSTDEQAEQGELTPAQLEARLAAERREALEQGEQTPGAGGEGEQPPLGAEPAEGMEDFGEQAAPAATAADQEKAMKQLEREAARHASEVERIMGADFAMLIPSPIDWTPGYVFNPAVMPFEDEQRYATLELLGIAPPPEYQEAPETEACEACAGLGEVLTGSRKEGQQTKPCVACTGTGWRTKAPQQGQGAGFAVTPAGQQPPPAGADPLAADQWGRPPGHPDYWKNPAEVIGR